MLTERALEMDNLMRGLDTESGLETNMSSTSLRLSLVISIPVKLLNSRLPRLRSGLLPERTSMA